MRISPSSPVVEHVNGISAIRVRSPPLEDDLPSILIIKKVNPDDQSPNKTKTGRATKRKRSPTSVTAPIPQAGSSKKSEKKKPASRSLAKSRGSGRKMTNVDKAKGREVGILSISQNSFDSHSISSRSSSDASAARRMLEPSSRGTSRASSIVSTAPSEHVVQPSPTLGKSISFRQQPFPPPPPPPAAPLLHRHHHNRPAPLQPTRSVQKARQTEVASTPSSQRHPTFSSSPVTRSNCRYHKISIPLDDESDDEASGDEDVKLVYFLVPGCSLGNAELNREEKIVDHGDAQPSDGHIMTPDLDSYAFNAPLLSVLRLLVGVDMLREGEIYYLPLPGSDWVPRKIRDTSNRALPSHVEPGTQPSPRRNASQPSLVNPPTHSNGAHFVSAPFRTIKPPSSVSQHSSQLNNEDSPQNKRIRSSPVGEDDGRSQSELAIFSPRSRRNKHTEQEAAEYLPDSADEEDKEALYPPASGRPRTHKGKSTLKRSRDIAQPDIDGQNLKRQKIENESWPV
ncbi:hypothetical protein H0H93_015341 [Arthromyces matolae]|nr:hypothetical protein H0H93_015341 [Arthromyces matolae]